MNPGDPRPAPRPSDPRTVAGSTAPVTAASRDVQPQRPRSCAGSLAAAVGVLLGGVYLLNPTWGLFELLPDALPGIGNLDEAGAAAMLIFGLRYFLARRR
jgi:hypothetical protein